MKFLTRFFARRRPDQDLDDELRAYVEEQAERATARGEVASDARRKAAAELGSLASMRLRLREERTGARARAWGTSVYLDVRLGMRRLLGAPRFSVPALLSLGLGIAIAITTFGVVNALALRPAAVPDGSDLLVVAASRPTSKTLRYLSYPNFVDLRARASAFRDLVAYAIVDARLSVDDTSLAIHSQAVSGSYFRLFGVKAWRGRVLTPEDDVREADPVVILSHGFAKRVFGAGDIGVGRAVRLNGQLFTVVGVVPDGFRGTDAIFGADLWMPLTAAGDAHLIGLSDRTARNIRVQGFAADGISEAQIQANVNAVAAGLREDYPVQNVGLGFVVRHERSTRPMIDAAGLLFPVSSFLMVVAVLGLLTDVGSVTSLLLARGIARRQETSIRFALGATRGRVVRELLVEAVLLAGAGAMCGLALATWILGILSSVELPGGVTVDARPDWLVVVFAVALPIVIGIAAGVLPALASAREGLISSAAEGARATTSQRAGRLRERVVAVQFAGLTVLLALIALFSTSIEEARDVDLGFTAGQRVLLTVSPREFGYDASRGREIVSGLLDRVTHLGFVRSAAAVYETPMGAASSSTPLAPRNSTSASDLERIAFTVITPGYFETLGIPILAGRDFDDRDRDSAPTVIIVNETLAKAYWPGENAIGKVLVVPDEKGTQASFEVVGVAATSKYQSATEMPKSFVWFPYTQRYSGTMTVVAWAQTAADEKRVIESARGILSEIDGTVRLSNATTLAAVVTARTTGPFVAGAWFVGVVAWIAFLRASFSLYGLLTYSTQSRARELAIRMAFGAGRRDVCRLVLQRTVMLALSGIALGLGVTFVASRALRTVLGTAQLGAGGWLGVPLLLVTVAVAASYLPLRRVFGRSPIALLRDE